MPAKSFYLPQKTLKLDEMAINFLRVFIKNVFSNHKRKKMLLNEKNCLLIELCETLNFISVNKTRNNRKKRNNIENLHFMDSAVFQTHKVVNFQAVF